jgi:hypothetical protein
MLFLFLFFSFLWLIPLLCANEQAAASTLAETEQA